MGRMEGVTKEMELYGVKKKCMSNASLLGKYANECCGYQVAIDRVGWSADTRRGKEKSRFDSSASPSPNKLQRLALFLLEPLFVGVRLILDVHLVVLVTLPWSEVGIRWRSGVRRRGSAVERGMMLTRGERAGRRLRLGAGREMLLGREPSIELLGEGVGVEKLGL
jgi:hypothetical protein